MTEIDRISGKDKNNQLLLILVLASVITAKAANGYHFKTGHSTSVRDRFLYSFGVN